MKDYEVLLVGSPRRRIRAHTLATLGDTVQLLAEDGRAIAVYPLERVEGIEEAPPEENPNHFWTAAAMEIRWDAFVRPEIRAFALLMEARMAAHDEEPGRDWWKGQGRESRRSWMESAVYILNKRARDRRADASSEEIINQAADVANYAMMTAHGWGLVP